MPDKYKNYNELAQCEKRGTDFSIILRLAGEKVAVIAIHGGKIEPGTREIAEAIAAEDLSFYSFIGKKPNYNYRDLHITSTKFDEPHCLNLLKSCNTVVSIHGVGNKKKSFIMIGGLDRALAKKVISSIERARPEGARFVTKDPTSSVKGLNKKNICNQCKSCEGVQLEISRRLRDDLGDNKKLMVQFAKAVRNAL